MSRTFWPTSISSTSTRYIALWRKCRRFDIFDEKQCCGVAYQMSQLSELSKSTEGKEEGRSRGSWKCINSQPHQDSAYRGLFKGFPSMRKKMLFLLRWNAQEWWRCTSNHNCWSRRKGASCCSHPMRWEAASQAITLGHVWLVALRAVYHPACLLSLYRRAKNKESHPLPKVETCAKSKAPTKWGWSMSNNGVYEPTYTTQPSLTDKFDCLVSCKCRGPCKPPCRCCVRQQLCLPLCACRGCVGASQ